MIEQDRDAGIDRAIQHGGAVSSRVEDAKVGQLYWDADVSVAGIKRSYDGDEPFVGVGAHFYITDNLAFVVEYDRYKVDLDDSDLPAPATRFEDDMDTFKIGGRLLF